MTYGYEDEMIEPCSCNKMSLSQQCRNIMTIDGKTTLMTNGQVQTGTQFTQKIKLAAKLEIL